MLTKTKLIKTLKTLKYFDSNFQILRDKIDTIDPGDTNKQKRLLREFELADKYITTHYFTMLNNRTLLTPQEFKFYITHAAKKGDQFVFIQKLQKKFSSMLDQEFNIFLEAHAELQQSA